MSGRTTPDISSLIPDGTRLLLTGGGKEFIKRIGVEAARSVIHHVMMGENLRKQTEPLTRRRVAQVSGGGLTFFVRGFFEKENFVLSLSEIYNPHMTA